VTPRNGRMPRGFPAARRPCKRDWKMTNRLCFVPAVLAGMFLAAGGPAPADEKPPKPKDRLVGEWQSADDKDEVMEFTKDDKLIVVVKDDQGKDAYISGKYKVLADDQLQITIDDSTSKNIPKLPGWTTFEMAKALLAGTPYTTKVKIAFGDMELTFSGVKYNRKAK
jgi:uncharacterized protein (TIGR03066 family)